MTAKIGVIATHVPKYSYSAYEIAEQIEHWVKGKPKNLQQKALKFFHQANIRRRHTLLPLEKIFSPMSLEEKNEYYTKGAVEMSERVVLKALDQAGLNPTDLDFIITTSCTGIMIPSVDAYLIDRLKMKRDILRLPITEMGCTGSMTAIIYAYEYLRANPGKKVAVVSVESPSVAFQPGDYSPANMAVTSVFGDGAACVILGEFDGIHPAVVDHQMYHFPDSIDMTGYVLKNSGLRIVVDNMAPVQIEEHFNKIIFPFLKKNNLKTTDTEHFIFHTEGKKIVAAVEQMARKLKKDVKESAEIIRDYGNMSGATILFVLEKYMKRDIKRNEFGLMMGFGPGFTAQTLLLKWC